MGWGELTTKVQYLIGRAIRILYHMKTKRFALNSEGAEKRRNCNFRNIATHHAIGIGSELAPEKRRLLELAVTEAEALACQTGVPELVLLSLAEEKVRATRKWLAKQEQMKARSAQWQLAA